MTKEQFNHEMERIASINWRGAAAAAQVVLCMRYIESLEAENDSLKADNQSLVEQINQIGLRMEHKSGTAQRMQR